MTDPLGALATALAPPGTAGRLQSTWQTQNPLEKSTTLSTTTFSLAEDISNRTCDTRPSQHLLPWKSPHQRGRWQITTCWLSHAVLCSLVPCSNAAISPPSWAGSKLPGTTLHTPQGKSLHNSPFLGSRCHTGTFHHVLMKHYPSKSYKPVFGSVLYRDKLLSSEGTEVCQAVSI